MNKALFLDRDGVINFDFGHVYKNDEFAFIDGIFDLCEFMQREGYLIIVVTNQAGIGKGFYKLSDFLKLDSWMKKKFLEKNIEIQKTYFCPHKPEDNCLCRKPKPGMLLKALSEFDIDPKKSVLIGDKQSDVLAGESAGIHHILLFNEANHFKNIELLKAMLNEG